MFPENNNNIIKKNVNIITVMYKKSVLKIEIIMNKTNLTYLK